MTNTTMNKVELVAFHVITTALIMIPLSMVMNGVKFTELNPVVECAKIAVASAIIIGSSFVCSRKNKVNR